MINRTKHIELLAQLGNYINDNSDEWKEVKEHSANANPWFDITHVNLAAKAIAAKFLQRDLLETWSAQYRETEYPKLVGIVMAGNIPLVGFHDLLCGLISGHRLMIRTSSKDEILIKHVVKKLIEWKPEIARQATFADRLNGCDAYIATGSNNTARYFEQYFAKWPHIIRRNRTSVAVLDGSETEVELVALSDDVYRYFGLGCRNVTQICVPGDYDFGVLLNTFRIKDDYANFHKYKNNLDYHLAIYLLNRVPYMSIESLLLVENDLPFSAVSVLHYRYYDDPVALRNQLLANNDIQAITGHGYLPFGTLQKPSLYDYADEVDTMKFLTNL